jgi:hypothetical protein
VTATDPLCCTICPRRIREAKQLAVAIAALLEMDTDAARDTLAQMAIIDPEREERGCDQKRKYEGGAT